MTGWPSLCGALGLVFVGFGLLSVLLFVAGAPTDLAWIWANFVIGVLLLGGAITTNFDSLRERMRSGEGRRIGKYGLERGRADADPARDPRRARVSCRTATRQRWDASEAGVHSISDQTTKVLEGLDQDVEIVAFYPKLDQANARASCSIATPTSSAAREGRVRRPERAAGPGREATGSRPTRSARVCSS